MVKKREPVAILKPGFGVFVVAVKNAYPVKDILKKMGYEWDPWRKEWVKPLDPVEEKVADELRKLEQKGIDVELPCNRMIGNVRLFCLKVKEILSK